MYNWFGLRIQWIIAIVQDLNIDPTLFFAITTQKWFQNDIGIRDEK